jgi:hypothetical protein
LFILLFFFFPFQKPIAISFVCKFFVFFVMTRMQAGKARREQIQNERRLKNAGVGYAQLHAPNKAVA